MFSSSPCCVGAKRAIMANPSGDERGSFFTLFSELGVSAFQTRAQLSEALSNVERELGRRTAMSGLSLECLPLCCPLCGARVWCEDGGLGRTILVGEDGAPHADGCAFERERARAETRCVPSKEAPDETL